MNNNKSLSTLMFCLVVLFPIIANAQSTASGNNPITQIVTFVGTIIIIVYFLTKNNKKSGEDSKNKMQ